MPRSSLQRPATSPMLIRGSLAARRLFPSRPTSPGRGHGSGRAPRPAVIVRQSIPARHDCRHAGFVRFHPGHLSCPPRPCPLRRHRHRQSSSPSTKVARSCSSSTSMAGCSASRSSQAWRKSGSACRHAHAHIRAHTHTCTDAGAHAIMNTPNACSHTYTLDGIHTCRHTHTERTNAPDHIYDYYTHAQIYANTVHTHIYKPVVHPCAAAGLLIGRLL